MVPFARIKKEFNVLIHNPKTFSRRLQRFVSSKTRLLVEPHLDGKAFYPDSILFSLTYRCNLRCQMCSQYGDDFKRLTQTELTKHNWLEVAKKIVKINPKKITISGGEPFLHDGCIELIRFLKKYSIFVAVITNGSLLAKLADELIDSGVDMVGVSLDGPEEIHNKIRRSNRSYADIITGIEIINQKKKEKKKMAPEMAVNTVITQWNQDNLTDMIEIVKPLGIRYLSFQHLVFHSREIAQRHRNYIMANFGDDEHKMYMEDGLNYPHGIDTTKLKQSVRQIMNSKKNDFYIEFLPRSISEDVDAYYNDQNNLLYARCSYPWSCVKINYKGDVTLCFQYKLGNILEQSFESMWNGPKAIDFRKKLLGLERKQQLFPACMRCCLRSFSSK